MTLFDEQTADDQGDRIRHSDAPREHAYQRRTKQEQGELTRKLLRRCREHVCGTSGKILGEGHQTATPGQGA